LEARVSHDQKALFQRAAELQGRTLTDFGVASVNDAAIGLAFGAGVELKRRSEFAVTGRQYGTPMVALSTLTSRRTLH
jgi:uncharacterized protein (DUF1778 family)